MKPQYYELPRWQCRDDKPAEHINVWPLFRESRWDSTQLQVETLFKNSIRRVVESCLRCELCGDYLRTGERTIGSRMHAEHFNDVFVIDETLPGCIAGGAQ